MSNLHFFGIRHHGPHCARALIDCLGNIKPDCVLIEGPFDANDIFKYLENNYSASKIEEKITPPVAILGYEAAEISNAAFYPFADFSPEWQAILWAIENKTQLQFMDLPLSQKLYLDKLENENTNNNCDENNFNQHDPLDSFAKASGFADGEEWWNFMIEERNNSEEIFTAIFEAMVELRKYNDEDIENAENQKEGLQNIREAHMRQCIRKAKREYENIAVICGAWHLGGLQIDAKNKTPSAKQDSELLKQAFINLKKVKTNYTWVPWTNYHLSMQSGYKAGIKYPNWYEHLWEISKQNITSEKKNELKVIGWLTKIAKLMRKNQLDCSSAHLIESAKLANALAYMRGYPSASIDEIQQAVQSVITMGEQTPLLLINKDLLIGSKVGNVPDNVPTTPLQTDLAKILKNLRLTNIFNEGLKVANEAQELNLDLRKPNDLAKSQLINRLLLLSIPWGIQQSTRANSKGTFHEDWKLLWQPDYTVELIKANKWGQTIQIAATNAAISKAAELQNLDELSELISKVLIADLPEAGEKIANILENIAATSSNAIQMLDAIANLTQIFKYSDVRQTKSAQIENILKNLIIRASIYLQASCTSIDDEAAHEMRIKINITNGAIYLYNQNNNETPPRQNHWQEALIELSEKKNVHPLIQGLATRILADTKEINIEEISNQLNFNLSYQGQDVGAVMHSANWLDGFLNENAILLLHDEEIWAAVNNWLKEMDEEQFIQTLPLIRRTFSKFTISEKINLIQKSINQKSQQKTTQTKQIQNTQEIENLLAQIKELTKQHQPFVNKIIEG